MRIVHAQYLCVGRDEYLLNMCFTSFFRRLLLLAHYDNKGHD